MWIFTFMLSMLSIAIPWAFSRPHGVSSIFVLAVGIVCVCVAQYTSYLAGKDRITDESSVNETASGAESGRHRKQREPPSRVDRKFEQTVLFNAFVVLVALITVFVTACVADGPDMLYGVPVSGAVNSSPDGGGAIRMGFPLKVGVSSKVIFHASFPGERYLNSDLMLFVKGSSCIGPAVAMYVIYSGFREVAHGLVSAVPHYGAEGQLNNVIIGAHEPLRIAVSLHASIGCSGDFSLVNPTLDRVTGWQQDLAELFKNSAIVLPI